MQERKLILHAGTPKTGTSAIQYVCKKNKAVLSQYGIDYIDFDNCYKLFSGQYDIENVAHQIISRFKSQNKVLISWEGIWLFNIGHSELFKILQVNGVEIQVIVYLRPQYDYIESILAQHIEDNLLDLDFNEWVIKRNEHPYVKKIFETAKYYKSIKWLEKTVGKENLVIRIYDREVLCQGDVCRDFFNILEIDDKKIDFNGDGEINLTLDVITTDVKKEFNKLLPRDVNIEVLQKVTLGTLYSITASRRNRNKEKPVYLTYSQKCEIYELFEEENEKLENEYFDGRKVFLRPKYTEKTPDDQYQSEEYNKVQYEFLSKSLVKAILDLSEKENRIKELEKTILLHNNQSARETKQIKNLEAKVQNQKICENELNAIKNSTSWKITAPLRNLVDRIRAMKHR